MGAKVYFIKTKDNAEDSVLCEMLQNLIISENLLGFIKDRDVTPIKTHFGEVPEVGYARPVYFKMLGDIIKGKGGRPFLTETSTLYKGNRDNAIKHISHAYSQGFDFASTGMPVIMADGLFGDDEYEVPVDGRIYKSVKIAALFAKCNALVVVSHFTGHLATGFGAALKNMGMGCASRKGKMEQHSTSKPRISRKKCTQCGTCIQWCPAEAISMGEESAVIDGKKCIGCGQCLAMCRFDAVQYNWSATHEELQKKVVEHALGLYNLFKDKSLYINILTRISKDCDCMGSYKKIIPDIGIMAGSDPVAVDSASMDVIEKTAGGKFSGLAYEIPYKVQLDYSGELHFGSTEYELIER